MPWESKPVMLLRKEFIAAHATGLFTVTELCGTFGITRNLAINRRR